MKVNKIICDKCKKELEKGTEIRLSIMKKEIAANGFSNGYKKDEEFDLCPECFNTFKNDYLNIK